MLSTETAKRREHERSDREDCPEFAAGEIGTAGGEATDPHQMLMFGFTRVSADKAVAPTQITLEEFEIWLGTLGPVAVEPFGLRSV